MNKKSLKIRIILTIVSLFASCIPLIVMGILLAVGMPNCFLGSCFTDSLQDDIRNAIFLFLALSFVIWLGPIIKSTNQKNNEREIRETSILKNNNLSPQEKTNLVESEKNTGFFLFSTVLSSVAVVIMIVIALINSRNMISAMLSVVRSDVRGMDFVTMIPFLTTILLEAVTTVFSIILFSKYKKLKKNGIEPTNKLKSLRNTNIILFVVILCWPVFFFICEIAYTIFQLTD